MSRRIEKISDLIRDNLAKIIAKELTLKSGVFISVTRVDTSRDFSYARVFVSVYPAAENEYAIKTLEKEILRLQKTLNGTLRIKIMPKISFALDAVQERVRKLDELFDQISKEK